MPKGTYLFTSESVSEGHPDKVSDRISDAVVDLYLGADPLSRVACETLTTTNRIVLAGEVRGPESITKEMIEGVARDAVKDIGYEQEGFHWKNAEVEVHLHQQSVDIAQGVDAAGNKDEGAGDQGIMFGFACDETPDLMPATLDYSHKILEKMSEDRHSNAAPFLEPDAKSQVTLRYKDGKPVACVAVVAMPDEKWGEVPCAFVELVEGCDITEADLIEHARGELAGYKRPKRVIFEALPKTSTGKILKTALRERVESLQ